ncbi:MAG TPA: DsrE family protein [Methanoregulaceae archaeon]|nr:DsrE family protein [Methanoregulaceae archaeon]
MEITMTHFVIFHINETGKGKPLISEIKNIRVDLGEGAVRIEVLANSDGVLEFLKDLEIEDDVRMLAERGVVFVVCANSLSARGLSPGQLMQPVRLVVSGVGELVRRQEDGFRYLKI